MKKLLVRITDAAKRLGKKKDAESAETVSANQHDARILHQEEEMRKFKTEMVGSLTEPQLAKGLLFGGWLTMILTATICYIFSAPFTGFAFICSTAVLLGLRRIPTVHCGLLYNFGRRTRIGFWEGIVWIPWMTGGQLKVFNVELFSYDIEREDTWSRDQMHLSYDIVFRFGIIPVTEKTVWQNLLWYFHVLFKTDSYVRIRESGNDLGQGLFTFVENPDVENALSMIVAFAKQSARQVIRGKSFKDVFSFEDGNPVAVQEKIDALTVELEQQMQTRVEPLVNSIGLRVTNFSLADIDFDDEATQTLQQEQLALIRARAQRLNYDELLEIGRKLSLDPAAGEVVLRTEIIRALQRASDAGLLGALVLGTALEKIAHLAAPPDA